MKWLWIFLSASAAAVGVAWYVARGRTAPKGGAPMNSRTYNPQAASISAPGVPMQVTIAQGRASRVSTKRRAGLTIAEIQGMRMDPADISTDKEARFSGRSLEHVPAFQGTGATLEEIMAARNSVELTTVGAFAGVAQEGRDNRADMSFNPNMETANRAQKPPRMDTAGTFDPVENVKVRPETAGMER